MNPIFIHPEHFSSNIIKERNFISKEMPNVGRFNFTNKNKLNIIPHPFSQNKNYEYQQTYECIPRFSQPEKFNNLYNFYEKENNKSEIIHNSLMNNSVIEIKDLLEKNGSKPINLKMLSEPILKFNQGKISSKSFGSIISYATNTNQGIVRNYNEDRVSIIINMNKPNNYKSSLPWPKISYFAVFDGHAGNKCAEYLRENLLKLICSYIHFPENIPEAIRYGFEKADEQFLNNCAMINGQLKDNSGTCGLILLLVNNDIYIGNVGDSRCIGSFNNGKIQRDITRDHKPNAIYEKQRILANGGRIYQTKTKIKVEENFILKNKILLGPYRVFPGRLSVSRTVGDAEGKIPILGGNPNVIICKPDIYKFNLNENDIDYFILGCDGIYDQLTSIDVFKCLSLVLERNKKIVNNLNETEKANLHKNDIDIHTTGGDIVDLILKAAMIRQSYDNVTCILVCFKNLLDIDYQYINENDNNNNNNNDIYGSIRRSPKILITSNSSNNYNNNTVNNKKNINIHGISKIIQKLKSGSSDSNIFRKKGEITLSNEVKEFSGKPLIDSYIKMFNTKDRDNSISNTHSSNGNSSINIKVENNNNNKSNNNNSFDNKEEKKNSFLSKTNKRENMHLQIIYKTSNNNNFLYNPKNLIKNDIINNSINNNLEREKSDNKSEDKKDKIYYNKKRIKYINKNKELSEPKDDDGMHKEIGKENGPLKVYNNSRNFQFNRSKLLNLNSVIQSNSNTLGKIENKNLEKNVSDSNMSKVPKHEALNMTSPQKKFNKNNYNNNNLIEISDKKKFNIFIGNNFFTEAKTKSNKVFYNLIRNKLNQTDLMKNFKKVNSKEPEPGYSNESFNNKSNTLNDVNKNKNRNVSTQNFNSFKSIVIRKMYPSYKNSSIIKNNSIDNNNHKYYVSTNNKSLIGKNSITNNFKIKEGHNNYNKRDIKNNEVNFNKNYKNHNELKVKYSSSQLRSNTEYNYKEKTHK